MRKAFIVYGTVVCILFAYVSYAGLSVGDLFTSAGWSPKGHSAYHK